MAAWEISAGAGRARRLVLRAVSQIPTVTAPKASRAGRGEESEPSTATYRAHQPPTLAAVRRDARDHLNAKG